MKSALFLSVFYLISALLSSTSSYKVVCYFRSWAYDSQGDNKFTIENIDPQQCTHLVYGFARLLENKITVRNSSYDLAEDGGLGFYKSFNGLKQIESRLKTLIALGGWNAGSQKYWKMLESFETRKTFIESCVNFLTEHGFDGLDFDWEFPNGYYRPEQKSNFASLLEKIKEAFRPHGFLLTAAVSAIERTIDRAYPIEALARYLDFINLKAFDFHKDWENFTVHNAPLYSSPNEADKKLNVNYSVNCWLDKEFPAHKIILGMSFYGRGFTLKDPEINGLGAPARGRSKLGQSLEETGMLGFNEICKIVRKENGWTTVNDENIKASYSFQYKEWIGYNNRKSIRMKVNYLKRKRLGGAMVWSLENDDFGGQCWAKPYPLLETINKSLGRFVDDATRSVDQG